MCTCSGSLLSFAVVNVVCSVYLCEPHEVQQGRVQSSALGWGNLHYQYSLKDEQI